MFATKLGHRLCLRRQRAIRTGRLHEYWNLSLRNNGSVQKGAAGELLNLLATVQVPIRGCGLEEIHRFQIFFATRATALVVYSFRNFARCYPPLYDGTRFVMDTHGCLTNTLRIMYYENSNHYQPILNLTGASGTTGYCIPCNKSYWHVEDHRCTNKCYKCLMSPPYTTFEDCFKNNSKRGSYNKNNSVCDKIKLCQKCFKIVFENIGEASNMSVVYHIVTHLK